MINQFLKSECFFDLQFIQYYKGFELLRRWKMKSHNQAVDFSNLEAIDAEVLADEAKEQEEATATAAAVEGGGATKGCPTDEGHVDEVVAAPRKRLNIYIYIYIYKRTSVASYFEALCLLFWGFFLSFLFKKKSIILNTTSVLVIFFVLISLTFLLEGPFLQLVN